MTLDGETIDALSAASSWDAQVWLASVRAQLENVEREASRRVPPVVRKAQMAKASARHERKPAVSTWRRLGPEEREERRLARNAKRAAQLRAGRAQ